MAPAESALWRGAIGVGWGGRFATGVVWLRFVAHCPHDRFRVFTVSNLETEYAAQAGEEWIEDVRYSPDGETIAIASHDNNMYAPMLAWARLVVWCRVWFPWFCFASASRSSYVWPTLSGDCAAFHCDMK